MPFPFHSVSIGNTFRLSFAHQHLSNLCLTYFSIYMYVVVALNTTIHFEKFLTSMAVISPYILPNFTPALACFSLLVQVLLATRKPTTQ